LSTTTERNEQVPLQAKVAFLKRPASYPEWPSRIEAIETHMSWVFLTERHAYKLKRPVRIGTLAYGSIAARRRHCEAEVSLNRRLAQDVYLGTLPLVENPAGALQLGGEGERLGAPAAGAMALHVYARRSGHRPPAPLVAFYRSRSACVRARLAIGHLDDPQAPVGSPWLDRAVGYLELAGRDPGIAC
jgi:aminoglycoside phosphotransferase family enzyme